MLFNYLLMNYYNFNSRINQILNKDNNKTYHNSINRNNSIEQLEKVNYDKLLKKKRKESIDCKKINLMKLMI